MPIRGGKTGFFDGSRGEPKSFDIEFSLEKLKT